MTLVGFCLDQLHGQNPNDKAPKGKIYTYKQSGDQSRQMEIYFPKDHDASKQSVPGIIMFHGGGWGGGKRKQFRYLCNYFASRGLVAATSSYKLAKKKYQGEGSRKRDCIIDAKSAIRWFKENAAELGVDPKRIIGGGGSAGAHIVLLASTNPGLNDPDDSKQIDTSLVAYLLFNPALEKKDSKDQEVNFLKHLKADLAPAIVFFGSDDKWLKGWEPTYKKIKKFGITSMEYWMVEEQKHGFFNNQPWADITVSACDRFLERLGLVEGEPTLKTRETAKKLVKQK